MANDTDENERVAVSTYVPPYQNAEWAEDAEEMGMSMSEFVRSMIQAGRRSFDLSEPDLADHELRDEIMAALRSFDGFTWDEMAAALLDGASEDQLERVLEDLQRNGNVVVSRDGRYQLNASDGA